METIAERLGITRMSLEQLRNKMAEGKTPVIEPGEDKTIKRIVSESRFAKPTISAS